MLLSMCGIILIALAIRAAIVSVDSVDSGQFIGALTTVGFVLAIATPLHWVIASFVKAMGQ